jgi:hypothetical protein
MRPKYDSSGRHSPEDRQPATGSPSSSGVSYVTLFQASRSLTDSGGQVRTSTNTAALPRHTAGVCTSLTLATLWMQEPDVAKGAGLNVQSTGKIKNALPGVDEELAHHLRVCYPPIRANRMGIRPAPCFRLTAASRGRLLCALHWG